jgi:hypothetical protein
MLNPLRHVLEPGDLFSGPAICLQRFCISTECLQRLSQDIQNVRFFFRGERANLQGLAECLDGFVVAPRGPQTQSDLHMGVPGILRVEGRVFELCACLVEHEGLLEHTTALIVVECGLRLFHA